jgi:Zn finger protein HypA/HybF involved in hydrogenase expression
MPDQVVIKCDVCREKIEVPLNEWVNCPKCNQSLRAEIRLVVVYGKDNWER